MKPSPVINSTLEAEIAPETPVVTIGNLIKGFVEWYNQNYKDLRLVYLSMPELQEIYQSVEEFAIDVQEELAQQASNSVKAISEVKPAAA